MSALFPSNFIAQRSKRQIAKKNLHNNTIASKSAGSSRCSVASVFAAALSVVEEAARRLERQLVDGFSFELD